MIHIAEISIRKCDLGPRIIILLTKPYAATVKMGMPLILPFFGTLNQKIINQISFISQKTG